MTEVTRREEERARRSDGAVGLRGGMFSSLTVRDFRFLWSGSLCSSFAMNIQLVARGYLIYEMTHSATKLAWVTLAFMLPQVLLALVGGALADRVPKKALMMGAQSLNCVAAIAMAAIVFSAQVQFWHFIAMGIFNGTLLALSMPSRQSMIYEVVGERHLMNAIALNSASMNLSRILGPSLSGALIALFHVEGQIPYTGVGLVYVVIAILYFTGAASVRFVRMSGISERRPRHGMLSDIVEGLAFVKDSRLMLGLVIMGSFPMMFGMPMQNLMPAFSRSVLHGGPQVLGLLMTSLGVGAIVGTLVLAKVGDFERKGRAQIIGCAAWSVAILLFTFADSLWLAVPLVAFAGIFSSSLTALNRTMMQLTAPPDMRGRIMSFDQIALGLMPVGIVPIGYLSDRMGVPHALQVSACLLFVLTAVAYWKLPEVWSVGRGPREHRPI